MEAVKLWSLAGLGEAPSSVTYLPRDLRQGAMLQEVGSSSLDLPPRSCPLLVPQSLPPKAASVSSKEVLRDN